ncbi:MAG TPA: hypothetical protein VEZ11_16080 [Thermoanaerobaculia bacterium]|nr:hypothetical protein [Thermoanaerobaculia bacterium]
MSVVVPIVGSVDGIGDVRWRTDVELTNDQPGEATVALTLPTAPGQPVIVTSIAPGDTIRFEDVIAQAFGMESALSPLIVQTLGRRSVSIRAVAYGVRGTDTFKLEPIDVSYGDTYFPLRALPGLSFNDDFRTNIGLSNLSERDAVFILALQRVAGRSLAITRITLPPSSMVQSSIQLLFPLITSGDGFRVVVECGEPSSGVYASVIANATNEATFISPVIVTELEQ